MTRKEFPAVNSGPLQRALPGVHESALALVNKISHAGQDLVDLGTGQGALAEVLANQGFRVTAMDINAEDFRALGDVAHVTCDFNDVQQFRNLSNAYHSKFDVVTSVEVIEHLENPWEYIRNAKLLLKPGGFLVLTTPNPSSWHSRLTFLHRGEYDDFGSRGQLGHVNPIAPWELDRIIIESGFQILEKESSSDIYQNATLAQRAIQQLARVIRPIQKGNLDGFCQVILARNPK